MDMPRRLVAAVAAFLALHVLTAHWDPLDAWGIDALVYLPLWAQGLFILLGLLLVRHSTRERFIHVLAGLPSPIAPWTRTRSTVCFGSIVALAGVCLFILLPSATLLLGDGLLYVYELGSSTWDTVPRVGRAPFTFWTVWRVHELAGPLWKDAANAYRLISYASGVLYLLLSIWMSGTLGGNRIQKSVVLAFLLTPGFIQLFFGYVENYPLLFPAILLYLLLGIHALRRPSLLWLPSLVLGLIAPLHFALLTLFPSLLVLSTSGTEGSGALPGVGRTALRGALALCAALGVSLAVVLALGVDPLAYLADVRHSHILPLGGKLGSTQPYHTHAPGHIWDILNQYALVAPSALLTLLFLRRPRLSGSRTSTFLLSASCFPVLFTVVANPEIGAFRDWDAFAFAALPLTLYAAVALIEQLENPARLAHIAVLVCGAAALHTGASVVLNADPAWSASRFADLLAGSRLSEHARSYGWETLGTHHRLKADARSAVRAYEKAIEANPMNARYWVLAGGQYRSLGRLQEAREACEHAVDLDSTFSEAHVSLGVIFFELKQYGDAERHFERAITLRPDLAEAHSNMGNIHYVQGNDEKALASYEEALRLNPGLVEIHGNMGVVLSRLGRLEEAETHYRALLGQRPGSFDGHRNLGLLYEKLGRHEQALRHLQNALDLQPGTAWVHNSIAYSHYMLGRPDQAIQHYQSAVRLDPAFAGAHLNLGALYAEQGRSDSARSHFLEALELDPGHPQAPVIRQWLQTSP